jgi:hypothetical protein
VFTPQRTQPPACVQSHLALAGVILHFLSYHFVKLSALFLIKPSWLASLITGWFFFYFLLFSMIFWGINCFQFDPIKFSEGYYLMPVFELFLPVSFSNSMRAFSDWAINPWFACLHVAVMEPSLLLDCLWLKSPLFLKKDLRLEVLHTLFQLVISLGETCRVLCSYGL